METKLTKIFLHGKLGKTYGKEWVLDVKSPAEAIRAIDINVGGALKRQLIKEGKTKFYKICLGNKDNALNKEEACNPSGNTDIHIIPAIKGKNSGWAKIVAAVVIIAISWGSGAFAAGGWGVTTGAAGTAAAGTVTGLSAAGMFVVSMSASLLLGGVTQLLAPTQNASYGSSNDDGRGSNIFQGNSTIISQGAAVGLVYGRVLVTPMPVALSLNNYDQSPAAGRDIEADCIDWQTNNGLIEYKPIQCP